MTTGAPHNPTPLDPKTDRLLAAWRDLEATGAPLPSDAEWERVWGRIAQRSAQPAIAVRSAPIARPEHLSSASRSAASRVAGGHPLRMILRLAPALAAAASIALLFGLWRWDAGVGPVPLAHHTRIDAIESFSGFMPVVVSTGGRDGIDVIWVLEES